MRRALVRAIELRRRADVRARVGVATDVYRLVNDAGDDVPGVVVDRFADVVRVDLYDPALEERLEEITSALRATGEGARAIIAVARARKAKDSRLFTLHGAPPAGHVVHEDGARFFVRAAEVDAVGAGLFVDHREGRRLVRAHARGGRVLNLFAHAGGFGVAALAGGATAVDHVDAARKAARWAAVNYALNGHTPRAHRFVVDDAFKFLARAARRGGQYDVIVCDPPTTAIDPSGKRFVARERLDELAEQGAAALRPGGCLLLSTNDRSVTAAHVLDVVRAAAQATGRGVAHADTIPLPVDVPAATEERWHPMRGAFVRLA